MAKIIGPGSLNIDITGFAPHLPVAGETTAGSSVRFSPGGKGNNQMTAAHRAGADAVIIAKRGDDFLGQVIKAHYEQEGMSEEYIAVDPTAETGSALIEVDEETAQNRIMVISGANGRVTRETVLAAEKGFSDADVVLAQFETPIESILAAKALAKRHGLPFIFNPAPYIDAPAALYDGIDFLTPNETEAESLTDVSVDSLEDCREAAKKLLEMGVGNVIITLGVRGAFYTNGKVEELVPSVKVKAVETTGAGDAFNGGFATAIAEGLSIKTALQFATCTAALSVTRIGSAESMPRREEILALMKKEFGIEL